VELNAPATHRMTRLIQVRCKIAPRIKSIRERFYSCVVMVLLRGVGAALA
jgi:hypothetical protein